MIPIFHKSYNSFNVHLNTCNFSGSFKFLCRQLFFPFVKARMINSAEQLDAESPCWGKPLSAKIWSPGHWNVLLIKPDFLTIYVLVARPPKLVPQVGYKKWNTWLYCVFCNSSKLVLGLSGLQVCQWISQNNQ